MIFDHLSASTSLLLEALRQDLPILSKELKDFLVEYYSYTATLSLISVDINVSSQSLLNPELEILAHNLVLSKYVGSLCGCWLELLLLIPRVFDLGRQWRLFDQEEDHEGSSVPSNKLTENMALFASLHCRILGWSPPSTDTMDGPLAGRIFQQALLLYLYTSFHSNSQVVGPDFEALIETTVAEAMSLFEQLPATVKINTSLCWPLVVIGSCVKNDTWRQIIRNRLNIMLTTIGIGNIRQTLQILEYVWRRESDDAGPWSICKVMQDRQIWISFA
jgi:Fungal specific transcription factor domain